MKISTGLKSDTILGPIYTGSGNTYSSLLAEQSCKPRSVEDGLALGRDDLSANCVARFASKYKISDGCWLWMGARSQRGYGMVSIGRHDDGRQINNYAHRVAYVLTKGSIPMGQVVMHRCDNPPCVNPDHLVLGTQADNISDAISKGRFVGRPNEWQRKLSDGDVVAIRTSFAKAVDLARCYGVTKVLISKIRSGRARKVA